MKDYRIAKQFSMDGDLQISLINIEENLKYINRGIIPRDQIEVISRYKILANSNKRLLARSFLYESLHEHYGVKEFDLGFNEYKKPFLKADVNLQFSLSYAKDYILVGISKDKRLGIDIEFMDPSLNISELAPAVMCPDELEEFNSYVSNPLNQRTYFFRLFSAKESIVKSFGTGMYFDMKDLNTSKGHQYEYNGESFLYHELESWTNEYTLAVCCEQ